jgi:hypothetical protein
MSSREYYLKEYGLDIALLPIDLGNAIASNYLENLIEPKEELMKDFIKNGIDVNPIYFSPLTFPLLNMRSTRKKYIKENVKD